MDTGKLHPPNTPSGHDQNSVSKGANFGTLVASGHRMRRKMISIVDRSKGDTLENHPPGSSDNSKDMPRLLPKLKKVKMFRQLSLKERINSSDLPSTSGDTTSPLTGSSNANIDAGPSSTQLTQRDLLPYDFQVSQTESTSGIIRNAGNESAPTHWTALGVLNASEQIDSPDIVPFERTLFERELTLNRPITYSNLMNSPATSTERLCSFLPVSAGSTAFSLATLNHIVQYLDHLIPPFQGSGYFKGSDLEHNFVKECNPWMVKEYTYDWMARLNWLTHASSSNGSGSQGAPQRGFTFAMQNATLARSIFMSLEATLAASLNADYACIASGLSSSTVDDYLLEFDTASNFSFGMAGELLRKIEPLWKLVNANKEGAMTFKPPFLRSAISEPLSSYGDGSQGLLTTRSSLDLDLLRLDESSEDAPSRFQTLPSSMYLLASSSTGMTRESYGADLLDQPPEPVSLSVSEIIRNEQCHGMELNSLLSPSLEFPTLGIELASSLGASKNSSLGTASSCSVGKLVSRKGPANPLISEEPVLTTSGSFNSARSSVGSERSQNVEEMIDELQEEISASDLLWRSAPIAASGSSWSSDLPSGLGIVDNKPRKDSGAKLVADGSFCSVEKSCITVSVSAHISGTVDPGLCDASVELPRSLLDVSSDISVPSVNHDDSDLISAKSSPLPTSVSRDNLSSIEPSEIFQQIVSSEDMPPDSDQDLIAEDSFDNISPLTSPADEVSTFHFTDGLNGADVDGSVSHYDESEDERPVTQDLDYSTHLRSSTAFTGGPSMLSQGIGNESNSSLGQYISVVPDSQEVLYDHLSETCDPVTFTLASYHEDQGLEVTEDEHSIPLIDRLQNRVEPTNFSFGMAACIILNVERILNGADPNECYVLQGDLTMESNAEEEPAMTRTSTLLPPSNSLWTIEEE